MNSTTDCAGLGQPPYDQLFIYYFEGRFPADLKDPGNGFIGNWEEDGFSFLFFSRPAAQAVQPLLKQYPDVSLIDEYEMDYDQWQGGRLAPIRTGRMTIVPAWQDRDPDPSRHTIRLDPGVVFGSGTHPTTRHCLAAIEMAFAQAPVRRVCDLGTGSGVLALAAAGLGAKKVLAVDLNRLAARTAWRNVRLNCLENKVLVACGDAEKFMDLPVDLVVSNIHYDVMQRLVGHRAMRRPKRFVLSGLLRSQARQIEAALGACSATIIRRWAQDGIWHTFYGKIG